MKQLLLAGLLLWAPSGPAVAQEAAPGDATAREAISQLRSPYCPGLMLEVCPSAPAELLRDSIRARAAAGASSEEIVEDVIARHGEQWRAVPEKRGAGLLAWIATPVFLLIGAGLAAVKLGGLRRLPRRPESVPLSDADRDELDAALAELERESEEIG